MSCIVTSYSTMKGGNMLIEYINELYPSELKEKNSTLITSLYKFINSKIGQTISYGVK